MQHMVPFNKPFLVGNELDYITEAVEYGNLSGDGIFTKKCTDLLRARLGLTSLYMTPSCTAALEMAAILCGLGPGDEVIMPSFTFPSTASSVLRSGARPVFVDVHPDTLNIDETQIEDAITHRTRAIIPVHYAGTACEMDAVLDVARRYDLAVIEDAAQGVNSFYRGKALGSMGTLGAFSFHETKNFISGQGGALCVNRQDLVARAEVIRDRGTDRQRFYRGEVDKYSWVDLGSAYVASELSCAFLFAQLEQMDRLQKKRKLLYQAYRDQLAHLEDDEFLTLPVIPQDRESNHHIFFILLRNEETRASLMEYLATHHIQAVTHYVPLHISPMGRRLGYREGDLPVTENLSGRLLRLPLYYSLTEEEQSEVCRRLGIYAQVYSVAKAYGSAT